MAFVLSSASRRALGAARVGSVLTRSNSLSLAGVTTATRSIGSDSRVVCITSGKGGVGKTTTAASIGMGLALKGKKTCVIDFDIGLRNLDIHLVCEWCDDGGGGWDE
jgi:Mrp family chromosome partitioning ATPase